MRCTLRQAVIAPALKRNEAQAATLRRLDEKIDKVAKRRQPGRKLPKVKKA